MSGSKISQLPAAASLTGSELAVLVQNGIDVETPLNNILGFSQNGTGAVQRTIKSKLQGYMVTPEDFGAVGDGSTDDTTAFQAALNSLTWGQSLYCRAKYSVGNVTVPAGVVLTGDWNTTWQKTSDNNYYTIDSQIKLQSGATITLSQSSAVTNLMIIASGLSVPCTTDAQCTTLLAQFNGIAITATGVYVTLRNLMILGFTRAALITATGTQGGVDCADVAFDCTNGISYIGGGTNGRWHRCMAWPFLTSGVSGVSNTNLTRGGTAYYFQDAGGAGDDWTTLVDCTAYGFAYSFAVIDGSNIKFIGCQADGKSTGVYAFYLTTAGGGEPGVREVTMLGCTVISHPNPVYVADTGTGTIARIIGCFFAGGSGVGIEVGAGTLMAIGNHFQGIGTNFKVDNGATALLSGNVITAGGTFLNLVSGGTAVAENNIGYNPVGPSSIASPPTSGGTYTAGSSPETIYMSASSGISAVSQNGGAILPAALGNNIMGTFQLGANETLVPTYGGTLTMKKMVH